MILNNWILGNYVILKVVPVRLPKQLSKLNPYRRHDEQPRIFLESSREVCFGLGMRNFVKKALRELGSNPLENWKKTSPSVIADLLNPKH